ncbi:alcohol dehydrogenase [Roseovarius faecimaris]|uniref:Alcohol dehydrogenase n=1 Tax=Roseovarius faecimaris TaxID=2494550 RepID=A0A6I6INU6_9RHOB|nr:zinc-binding dehydrogenase [Roseovarius faecimaris]QGX97481.1 alcohol dehydrogenase [Roseovarius faecimaris]
MKVKAAVVTGLGGPEVLHFRDIDLQWPAGPQDVLVELRAAALNPADTFFRQLGGYLETGPFVLGHDGMGIVKAVGDSVTNLTPGDRVCFCNGGIGGTPGTYAEAAIVPAWQLAKVPDGVDDLTAAALPLVAITGWEALYDRAHLDAGEHVLIHAGAGGTGHVAIQLARLRGAKVATTVSGPEKAALAQDLGADLAINYHETDLALAARDWSGGLDVALDNVGEEAMRTTYAAMAPFGRVVTLMGVAPDDADMTAYNMNLSILNVMMLTPMWLGLTSHLRAQADIVRKALALVDEGNLRILHAQTFPLDKVADAHAFLESGQAIGKVTLEIR